MTIEELFEQFTYENVKQYALIFYILGIYYSYILLKYFIHLKNKFFEKKEEPDEYFISQEKYDEILQSSTVNMTVSLSSSVNHGGNTTISKFSGTAKYVWDGVYLSHFAGTKILEFDGQYISKFSGTKLYTWKNNALSKFAGTTMYTVSSGSISKFSGTKLYTFDNNGISEFAGVRLYSFNGQLDVPPAIIILIAEGLEGL